MALNNNTLRTLQQYRYTLVLVVVLLAIALIFGIIYFNNPQPVETPLTPKAQVIHDNPTEIQFDWTKVKLGMTEDQIEKQIGKPTNTQEANGIKSLIYMANPKTPLATHVITIKDNKVIAIKRNVDSHNQIITRTQYDANYGQAELIRPQSGVELPALYGYTISNNEYLIIEVDEQNNQVYNIMTVTKEQYESIKKEERQNFQSPDPNQIPDHGFEAF